MIIPNVPDNMKAFNIALMFDYVILKNVSLILMNDGIVDMILSLIMFHEPNIFCRNGSDPDGYSLA